MLLFPDALPIASGGAAGAGMTALTPSCEGKLTPNDCATCVEAACCPSLLVCEEDMRCVACVRGSTSPKCAEWTSYLEFKECIESFCSDVCKEAPPPKRCNPITNEGCDNGEACDLGPSGHQCYPPPNDRKICETCDPSKGLFCAAGGGCVDGRCFRYCCNKDDCGSGFCDKKVTGSKFYGVCVDKPVLVFEETTLIEPACDAPAVAPSQGLCFPVQGGPNDLVIDCKAPLLSPSSGNCLPPNTSLDCNPVTNGGCKIGQACDGAKESYRCYPPPNTEEICDACDHLNGLHCRAGHACIQGKCAKYCCDDSDCSEEGVCSMKDGRGIGVCLIPPPGAAGVGGSSSL
ncbi:MAG: hypothetical protein RMJ98_05305 [Myxococcales bacterium]|nr:hypothetical protein [Polyangiaceae bacterium]MDW8248707.1 hypothetical protein [Myxococcales bacterium]